MLSRQQGWTLIIVRYEARFNTPTHSDDAFLILDRGLCIEIAFLHPLHKLDLCNFQPIFFSVLDLAVLIKRAAVGGRILAVHTNAMTEPNNTSRDSQKTFPQ